MKNCEFYKEEIKKAKCTSDLTKLGVEADFDEVPVSVGSFIKWLFEEHVEGDGILSGFEKIFLNHVMYPFKDNVTHIEKKHYLNGNVKFYICIFYDVGCCANRQIQDVRIPFFEDSNLFSNLAIDKEYTLKELGL